MNKLPKTYVEGFHDKEMVLKMEYNKFGATGLEVSKLSLGGGPFGNHYGSYDEAEAIATVHAALKNGINYIDTAPWYGHGISEQFLGKALKDVPRSAYYIGTKVGRYEPNVNQMFDFSAAKTLSSVDRSLKLLQLDYVDVIQIHDVEFCESLDILRNETLPALQSVVASGKAKFIGLTGYDLTKLQQMITMAPRAFDMVLSYARHILTDDAFFEYTQFYADHKLGVVCASGMGMGLLTQGGPQAWHPAGDDIKQRCRDAANVCATAGVDLAKLAIWYFMSRPGAATYLVGVRNREELLSNLAVYYNGLSERELDVLRQLQADYFKQPSNWEGIEVALYWAGVKKQ